MVSLFTIFTNRQILSYDIKFFIIVLVEIFFTSIDYETLSFILISKIGKK